MTMTTRAGGALQVVMEMMKQEGRQDILHVPCKGPGPVMRGNIRAE